MRELIFDYSPWFLLLCFLAGLAYAWFLYPGSSQWRPALRWLLFGLRCLAVFFIAALLLGPLLRQLVQHSEPSRIVFAVDNSQSIPAATDSLNYPDSIRQQLQQLAATLEEGGREVSFISLSQQTLSETDSLNFDANTTDLSSLLKNVQETYENRNLQAVVLLSDGRYNQGLSPDFLPYPFPVYTLGVGDTIPKTDVMLSQLFYNKLVYQGNQFILRAEVMQQGLGSRLAVLQVLKDGKLIDQHRFQLPAQSRTPYQHEFVLDADEAGLQRYRVKLVPLEGEFSTANNEQQAYLEVLEGKQKILIAAAAPHPDIKAIRSALEQNTNYEILLYIPGLNELPEGPFDLLVLHQIPSHQHNAALDKLIEKSRSKFYILGRQSSISAFNQQNQVLEVQASGTETDEVFPSWQNNQDAFKLPIDLTETFATYPPVIVPYGDYRLKKPAEILLKQRVGSITTDKPLLVLQTEGDRKTGVLLGEGSWRWRLEAFKQTDSFRSYDELIQRTAQVLTSKEDRRLFRVYPLQREVPASEPVIFETEAYNSAMQPVYQLPVQLQLTDEAGESREYTYTTSQANTRYSPGTLAPGVYRYTATSSRGGEQLQASGQFSVQALQLETQNLTADFALLRNLAENSGGQFYTLKESEQLARQLNEQTAQSILYADEALQPVLNLPWLFFFLLLLLSTEWFLRKYNGGY